MGAFGREGPGPDPAVMHFCDVGYHPFILGVSRSDPFHMMYGGIQISRNRSEQRRGRRDQERHEQQDMIKKATNALMP